MMKFLIVLLFPLILHAGRTSLWSPGLLLKDPAFGTPLENLGKDLIGRFNVVARPNPFNPSTMLYVSGILPQSQASFYIYTIDGKRVADLSAQLHAGYSSVVWKAPGESSGLLLAVLQNGNRTKTIKLIMLK